MRTLRLVSLALVSCSAFGPSASALDCRISSRPAATLLFPYFEVDLASPAGATTLISISNAAAEPALANVVVWTDCGFPALSFPVYLAADAVQSLNLRSILAGQLPVTGAGGGEPFPGCADPLEVPALDAEAVAALRARFGGEPDPDDGQCYGSSRPGSQVAKGYVTVDAVRGCSDSVRTPRDDGYFAAGSAGRASDDNVLSGDFFLVDAAGNSAQGSEAVSVLADAEYFAGHPATGSFYGSDDDHRYPLSTYNRTRYLDGGGFDGGTEVILWLERNPSYFLLVPAPCASACGYPGYFNVNESDESGAYTGTHFFPAAAVASRVAVGGEEIPVTHPFGTLEFFSYFDECPVCSSKLFLPLHSWVMPIYTAEGRFSAGLPALRLDNPCDG
jgi:hypothetical protein